MSKKETNVTKTFEERIGKTKENDLSLGSQWYSIGIETYYNELEEYIGNKYFQNFYTKEIKLYSQSVKSTENMIKLVKENVDKEEMKDLCIELAYRILVEPFTIFELEEENTQNPKKEEEKKQKTKKEKENSKTQKTKKGNKPR